MNMAFWRRPQRKMENAIRLFVITKATVKMSRLNPIQDFHLITQAQVRLGMKGSLLRSIAPLLLRGSRVREFFLLCLANFLLYSPSSLRRGARRSFVHNKVDLHNDWKKEKKNLNRSLLKNESLNEFGMLSFRTKRLPFLSISLPLRPLRALRESFFDLDSLQSR